MRDRERRSPWMVAALAAVAIISVAGCGTTVKTTTKTESPTATTPTNGGSGGEADVPPAPQSPMQAKIGSTISLSGFGGVKMDVTVTGFMDPTTGGEFDEPSPGARFVGVKLRLKNIGQKAYDDAPENGAELITNTDEEADPELTLGGACDSPSVTKIAPGDTRNVCIPFELPNAKKGMKFQFTLNSGLSDETGEWLLT